MGLVRARRRRHRIGEPRRHRPRRAPARRASSCTRNTFAKIGYEMNVCTARGLGPSISIFEPGFLQVVLAYARQGALPPGTLVKFYFAGGGYLGGGDPLWGSPPIIEALDLFLAMFGDTPVAVGRRRARRLAARHADRARRARARRPPARRHRRLGRRPVERRAGRGRGRAAAPKSGAPSRRSPQTEAAPRASHRRSHRTGVSMSRRMSERRHAHAGSVELRCRSGSSRMSAVSGRGRAMNAADVGEDHGAAVVGVEEAVDEVVRGCGSAARRCRRSRCRRACTRGARRSACSSRARRGGGPRAACGARSSAARTARG